MRVKSHIWIETGGKMLLGPGRVKLLNAIHELGSMNKAAKSMNMSYKKAWEMVNDINLQASQPVVEKVIGGKGGGGAKLTSYGLKMIDCYQALNEKCWEFLVQQEAKIKEDLDL